MAAKWHGQFSQIGCLEQVIFRDKAGARQFKVAVSTSDTSSHCKEEVHSLK